MRVSLIIKYTGSDGITCKSGYDTIFYAKIRKKYKINFFDCWLNFREKAI